MRRRRRRWPFVVLAVVALIAGAGIGVVLSGAQPSADLLAFLGGNAASPAATPDSTDVAVADPSADGSTGPGGSVGPSAAPSEPAGSSAGSSAPARSPGSSAAASASASGKPGAKPSPSTSGTATGSGGQAHAVYNGSRAKKVVALTFDDGYNPTALRQILAVLKREHVTATFFPYGWAVHNDPAGWHMVVAAGYPIGNHTLTHSILTSETPAQVTNEMVHGRHTIDLDSGGKSVNLMRPPGGAFNAVTAKAIKAGGYDTMVMWDVDTFDWQGPSADTIYQRAIKGTNGSIVLMHSGPLNTPKALPRIIANYRARGFTFVTVPQLLGVG